MDENQQTVESAEEILNAMTSGHALVDVVPEAAGRPADGVCRTVSPAFAHRMGMPGDPAGQLLSAGCPHVQLAGWTGVLAPSCPLKQAKGSAPEPHWNRGAAILFRKQAVFGTIRQPQRAYRM